MWDLVAGPENRAILSWLGSLLCAHARGLRAQWVARLALFGSLAREKASPDSNVDIAIGARPGRRFSIFGLGEVHLCLGDRLGRDVGVVIDDDLRPASAPASRPTSSRRSHG